MAPPHTFLVVPAKDEVEFANFAKSEIIPSERSRVRLLTDASKARYQSDISTNVSKEIIAILSAQDMSGDLRFFVHRESACDTKKLAAWLRSIEKRTSRLTTLAPTSLRKELKQWWVDIGIQWKIFANNQLRKFDGRKTSLDAWLEQFALLGVSTLGKKIAMQLRVIRLGEIPGTPLSLSASEQFGIRQVYGYVRDDDVGGSWVSVQDELTKSHPVGTVFPIDWDKEQNRMQFPGVPCDEFVLYEDGLWSGKETVKRLQAIHNCPTPALVRLKFGVVTDFGLLFTRHAIRHFGLAGKVNLDASASELIRFLPNGIPSDIKSACNLSVEDYYEALHDCVIPQVFKSDNDWTPEEQQACEAIGSQLVERWLNRGTGRQATTEQISRFALGGGRFASTTLFSRSVPKVCLPLLWLDGSVSLEGKSIDWHPLFVDSRRVGDEEILWSKTGR
jgi:hypothetical protein